MNDQRPTQAASERGCGANGPGSDPAKRRQILEGAGDVFLNRGFSAASMAEIARAAKVSKGTLYAYFENKETLFVATVEIEKTVLFGDLFDFDLTAPVEDELSRLGHGFSRCLNSPRVISTMRAVIGIAEQMPALGARFFERGPMTDKRILADYLQHKTEEGVLDIDDTTLAATQFIELCLGSLVRSQLLGRQLSEGAREAEITTLVSGALRVFFAAYAGPKLRLG